MPNAAPWQEALRRFDPRQPTDDVRVLPEHSERIDLAKLDPAFWVYPVLTAPLAGKAEMALVCPAAHTTFASAFLSGADGEPPCTRFLFAGTSGLDEDVTTFLAASVQPTVDRLHIVGMGSDVQAVASRIREKIPALEASPLRLFTDGFRHYVEPLA